MDVVVAGGHGQVGMRLLRLLAERGHRARGLIRNPDHEADLREIGAEPVLCDIEALDDISACCEGADAFVFAAGAGPGSGPERKRTVDYGGAVKLIEAARELGVARYVIVSSMGTDDIEPALGRRGEITREDTAHTVLETLQADNSIRIAFDVLEGDTPVREAVA